MAARLPTAARLAPALFLLFASTAAVAGEGPFASRIYRPDPLPSVAPAWTSPAPVDVAVETSDGLALHGYYWAPTRPDANLVVFFHGNGGNRVTAAQMAEPLRRDGSGLLVASYRGYGDNPGRPSQEGLFRDGAAFLAKARALAPGRPIVLFGYSLGGAVALQLAADEKVRGVVTLGAFASLRDVAPVLARGLLTGIYDNRTTIGRVDEPVLLLHGTADEVLPIEQAQVLQAAARRARLLRLDGAAHHVSFVELAPIVAENIAQMPE